jgi:ribosomal protein S27AE
MAKRFFCMNCGFVGDQKMLTKGSILIEIALWIFFIVPGLIYSLWRLTTKHKACPKCGANNMIPEDSPMAQQHLAKMKNNNSEIPWTP